jgi:alkaline phosphatase
VKTHFSAGTVNLEGIDTKKDGALKFTGEMKDVAREPDAVKWLDDNRFVVANEGDWKGGARGFTIFDKTGKVLYENGAGLEREIAKIGHYPEHRNKKGIEPEGVEVGTYGDSKLLFVGAERASLVGVYQDTGAAPNFLQALPSGIGPEGLLAIPARNLFVTANETDLGEDGLARSHVMVFERAEGKPAYPTISAGLTDKGRAARLGRAVRSCRGPGNGRQALCGFGFRLRQPAGGLHDRRHPDASEDHRQDRRHPQRQPGPEARS